jgi:hypothetical protein
MDYVLFGLCVVVLLLLIGAIADDINTPTR